MKRPAPPFDLVEALLGLTFAPAPGLTEWARATFLDPEGPLHNPDHAHLVDADLAFLWASSGYASKGRRVVGKAEDTKQGGMGNPWAKARVEQQLSQWFGHVPRFLITIDAFHAAQASDVDFCALVEHELYHCAHITDEFGQPAYGRNGEPKLGLVAHDVEEFVGVVRRYGPGDPDSSVARMVIAAAMGPKVETQRIGFACGNCLARVIR